MKKLLRILAVLLVVGAAIVWFATGANRGWTTNEDSVKKLDEVTGIEGISQVKKFRPGVDFLGLAAFGAVVLVGVSFVFRSKTNLSTKTN